MTATSDRSQVEAAGAPGVRRTVALRPGDFTPTGHVGNIRFPELAEIARIEWLAALFAGTDSMVPYALIRAMQVDFLGTVRVDSPEVWVENGVWRIGRTSFTVVTTIGVPEDDSPRARLETVHVVTEPDEATTREINEEERAMLQRYVIERGES